MPFSAALEAVKESRDSGDLGRVRPPPLEGPLAQRARRQGAGEEERSPVGLSGPWRPVVRKDDFIRRPSAETSSTGVAALVEPAPAESVARSSSCFVLNPSHAHAQWQSIAEGFTQLLTSDFVDLVFKVRDKPYVVAAHRTLVAAAWPTLRQDLRRLGTPPPHEVRVAALSWVDITKDSFGDPITTPPSAGRKSPSPRTSNSPPPTSEAAAPGGARPAADGAAASAPAAAQPPPAGGAKSAAEMTPEVAASSPGVLDVSSKMWGNYSILRALLCHLYNKPVVVYEHELTMIWVAAKQLGNIELAKSCEDMERRPIRTAWGGVPVSRSSTPELPQGPVVERTPALLNQLARASTAPASGGADDSCASNSREAIPGAVPTVAVTLHVPPVGGAQGQAAEGAVAVEASPRSGSVGDPTEAAEAVTMEARAKKRPEASYTPDRPFTGEARALPMAERAKPRGERSFTMDGKAVVCEKPPADTGSVRRVLSEIKRNIVESSRIIADKTFQQMYEMVPGERGILGEGINGPVRMAKHRKTGREVAVKRISCVNLSEQRRQMLVSEVRIFLQVSHRNIVQLLEVYESEVDQAVLLIMELCTGKELFERLAERRWYSEFDAARVARQMLDAVSYLHSQNICHRDLKLENWLYENPSQEAKLKLCDFGFGQIVEPSVQLTATLGSLFYVAPEVLEGSYGLPCDMWSVGVIVYMLLSGVPPFDGKTDSDVMAKIRQGRFVCTGKRWEGISETAKHFVRSMLRKDPYERLTAAEAAQHAWLKMECQPKLIGSHQLWPKTVADPELELPIDRGVIRDMWKFAQNNAITRAALGMLAKLNVTSPFGGKEEDVHLLEQRFRAHDEQNTGKIDAESFIQVLKETLHVQISSADEKQFFERIAGNIHGPAEDGGEQKTRRRREVNYVEFIALTKARRMANNTAAIREAFRSFDVCREGYIKEDDMHNLLGDEFKTTIEKYVDLNGKDLIDYLQFASIISQEMAKKEEVPGPPGPSRETSRTSTDAQPVAERAEPRPPALPQSALPASVDGRRPEAPPSPSPDAAAPMVGAACSPASTGGALPAEPTESLATATLRSTSVASDPEDGQVAAGGAHAPVAAAAEVHHGEHGAALEATTSEPRPNSVKDEEAVDPEECEEEECDAEAQSDEEQLVNVKNGSEESKVDDQATEREAPHQRREIEKSKDSRFQSFSLSLAGSSEYDDVPAGVNRVLSMPSDKYNIRQLAGFHSRTLRPFYAARPVSNVVMGLIRGTSLYAKQSVAAKLATIIHTTHGWFFIMPNPKYHTEVDTRKGLLSKETGKFRFVAWWIHPRFVPQLRQWFERLTYEDQERQEHRREAHRLQQQRGEAAAASDAPAGASGEGATASSGGGPPHPPSTTIEGPRRHYTAPAKSTDLPGAKPTQGEPGEPLKPAELLMKPLDGDTMGSPGDFRFSDVPKPENYLHTYRDLHTREHVNMLVQLNEGTRRFLRSLFDENFMQHASISAGFHYPVRTQYATLHMQLRVNAGNICGEDGRGIEVNTLIDTLKRDRTAYDRDAETFRYCVTENVKVSLLAAASEYEEQNPGESACRQIAHLSYELGQISMPTIHDEGEEEEEEEDRAAGDDAGAVDRPASRSSRAVPRPPPQLQGEGCDDARAMQIAENHEAADEVPASYLLNIQPRPGTAFHKLLYERRQLCAETFGSDPTYLYPLHVSVTGFFEASEIQVKQLKVLMVEMLQRELRDSGALTVGEVICTKTGYILFDVKASAVTNFAQRLGEQSARQLGLHIRPKAVNHISLACNRPDEAIREKIRAVYEPADGEGAKEAKEAKATATFDLVFSRLLARSSFERFAEDGPHKFAEVARIHLQVEELAALSGEAVHKVEQPADGDSRRPSPPPERAASPA